MKNNYLAFVGVLVAASMTTLATGQAGMTPDLLQKTKSRVAVKGEVSRTLSRQGTVIAAELRGAIANDACADAQVLTVNLPGECPANGVPGDNAGTTATDGEPTCDPGASAYEDVWYGFNSGAYTSVTVNIVGGTITDLVVDVLEGGCGGTSVACAVGDAATALVVPVSPGTDYVFSVAANNDFGVGGTFDVCLTGQGGGAAPANDECAGATSLTVGTECTPVTATVLDATSTLPSILCNGFTAPGALDVWFSFVATGAITNVQVDGVGTMDAVIEGFTGDCGALVSVGCADATFPPGGLQETLTMNTVSGTTYYVRVYHYGATAPADPEFSICAFAPSNVPANDQCDAVTADALAAGGSVNWTGDNTGALDTEAIGTVNVWHAFTTTECTNISVAYCGMVAPFQNVGARLYVDCPYTSFIGFSSGNFDDCGDGNATVYFDAVPAGTYYYAVLGGVDATGAYEITVTAEACAPPPANDACAGAQGLFVYTVCTPIDGNTESSDQTLDPIECNAFTSPTALDVWYSFVATGTDHTVTATGTNGADLVIELFSGTCDAATSLACSDATIADGVEEIIQSGLTVGETYSVRVYNYGGTATFNICVTGDIETAVNDLTSNSAVFAVFPNPSNGDVTISSNELVGATSIEVLDMTGRLLHTENRTLVAGQAHQVQLAGRLATGSYVFRLSNDKGTSEQRVVIR
ncbi:MAG TPA: T9SS type A sorting domain-containing protein [Flavobacteriales bacterium]|jgi:hypothetical protein|nr:T9SS type A sorting domain-containing protein [Flavobacteriales bacterium]